MSDRPSVGGLDPRFAPRQPGRFRMAIIFAAILVGAVAGVLFAASSVPDPNCAAEDGMCKLQRIYLAQAVKVVGAMLLAFLLADGLLIRLPDRMEAGRRRRAYELEKSLRPPPEPPRPFDAAVARAALDRVGQAASLPPAALRILAEAPSPEAVQAKARPVPAPAEAPAPAPARTEARRAWAAVNTPASLPPAALAALEATRAAPPAPPAPAPEPPAPDPRVAARAALAAVSQPSRLPPAALEALLRQGPALGGGPRRPPAEPTD